LKQNIPKTIHYCWFGGGSLPPLAERCMESWREFLPGYSIKRWDETNTDISENCYAMEAHEAGKYAFVSDYVRLKVLYEEGGIYMDTDVEVLGTLDPFLHHKAFCGFQNPTLMSLGVVGAVNGHGFINSLLEMYKSIRFLEDDGRTDLTPNTVRVTDYSLHRGLILNNKKQEFDSITIYPNEYFCPKNYDEYHFNITSRTRTIHHYSGSWYTPATRRLMWFRVHIIKRFMPWADPLLRSLYHRFF